jgi:hypothetical protein
MSIISAFKLGESSAPQTCLEVWGLRQEKWKMKGGTVNDSKEIFSIAVQLSNLLYQCHVWTSYVPECYPQNEHRDTAGRWRQQSENASSVDDILPSSRIPLNIIIASKILLLQNEDGSMYWSRPQRSVSWSHTRPSKQLVVVALPLLPTSRFPVRHIAFYISCMWIPCKCLHPYIFGSQLYHFKAFSQRNDGPIYFNSAIVLLRHCVQAPASISSPVNGEWSFKDWLIQVVGWYEYWTSTEIGLVQILAWTGNKNGLYEDGVSITFSVIGTLE